jgi:phosphate transport system substrate-binding protein
MLKQWRIAFLVGVAIALTLFISACGSDNSASGSSSTPSTSSKLGTPGAFTCVQGSITASGSTALQPLVTKVAQDYQSKCPGANITVSPGGSKVGLSNAENGTSQIGNSDIFAAPTQSDLVDHQVAVVVFVLAVNPSVTGVTNLTTDQIKSIYTGKVTNWNQVGGPDQTIVAVERPASSGTRATFKQYILGGAAEAPAQSKSLTVDSTGTVIQTVEQTKGAIGYVTLGAAQAEGSKLVILNIDGNAPNEDLVKNNTYKFWNIEHMYTKGSASGLAQALIDYMASDSAKSIASSLKFILKPDMSQAALQAHQPAS